MQEKSGYELIQELYKGSNSLVYRACREENKQPVILKMLRQAHPSPEKIARFKLEFDITRNLNAAGLPGVVQVYALETKQHGWMMALEDFGGEALNWIVKRRQFSLAELLQLFIQIVDIISQVHQQRVIHKDINPSNFVLNLNTGQLKVIDFGIATTLSRENPTIRNVNVLEGTLAYMSPEQTGRMNRVLDYRTDYYSVGVTFYELLTGELPFPAADALELVHCHIARQPVPPWQLKPDIPKPLSDIVIRLMAKNAEDRYQSAFSLKADLETCLSQWQALRQISPFPLGQHDVSDQFQLPQKLYGRQREIDVLLAAFERVSAPPLPQAGETRTGRAEVLLISGYTGIGKSALVQEVYKPITRQRGYFITGKFDLLKPDTPYAPLLQAFRLLVRQLLAETESEVAAWREKLLSALGPNGQVINAVIPEVELIIGPQPPAPDLPPVEAQNRFNFVFQNFIKVFTRAEHPLVIFLDDLQWADSASLKLLNVLTTAGDSEYLFVIGAYRDNDITAAHPLLLTLEQIQQAGTPVNHISLSPLSLNHIGQLVVDTLHCPLAEVQPLAELVLAKTNGNPFFINEFMKSLHADGLLAFDYPLGRWRWDLEQIKAQNITDNVAELMGRQVQKLDQKTQRVLNLAACIGSQFDLRTLSIVCEQSAEETAANLWPAVLAGLVLPVGDAYHLMNIDVLGLAEVAVVEYRFAHDQIQQAAYALIPDEEKQAMHLRVGRLLLQHSSREEQDRSIFDIVNHLNLGRDLVHDRSQRHELARLNLQAGRKAKLSAAYQPALTYLEIGLELLFSPFQAAGGPIFWEDAGYDLALALHVEAAEAAYLNASYEQMERWVEAALQQAVTLLDKVRTYEILIQAYIAQNKWPEAMRTGLFVLRLLKINFPKKPKLPQILLGLAGVKLSLAGKRIQNLQDVPEMRDPNKLAAMRILRVITGAIFVSAPELFPLIVFKQVHLSVRYGNTAESALAYATYGIIMCGVVGDIKSGYEFGQLALKVLERFNARQLEAQILFVQYFFILPWKEHVTETLKPLLLAYQSGLETGDLEFAANPISVYVIGLFFTGRELSGFEQEMASFNEVLLKLKQERPLYLNNLYWQASLNLTGAVEIPGQLVGERYHEDEMLPLHLAANDLNATCHLYLIKMILAYLFQDYAQAVASSENLEKYTEAFTGMYTIAIARFYESLAHLAIFPAASKSTQKRILKKVAANQKKMKKWSRHAPMNFLHKFYLVEAERARVLGQDNEARGYYDQAIELARQHQYVNEEALAGELAAQFCMAGGQTRLAQYYLHDAYYAYQRWGATAKVNDLEKRYPQLRTQAAAAQELSLTTSSTGHRVSSTLDLTSVLKASQAISSEIVLDRLLTTLMKIVIENAGAQSGYLILDKNGQPSGDQASQWVIEARGEINQPGVTALQSVPVSTSEELAVTIVNYVARTRESVVLDDASQEGIFTQDPYILRAQPKSILCMPLLNQGKLNGILYLENNLATAAFTPDRLQVLTLLSGQAAISVENARLYTRQVELTNAASRFIPHGFLAFLQKTNIVDVKLGDQVQRNMAILVSDIRSFTTLSEKMTPQANFDFVNTYLGHVSPIISQHNGLIVKYMGDGIMAVFPGQVEDGLNAALAQQKQVARYNVERRQQGEVPIQIGIGLHAGTMMLGTVGETQRMQLDLFSDTVNSAARLEGLTKRFGVGLVISAEAIAQLKDPTLYHLRFLGKVPVKGRQKMLSVFEVFDSDPEEIVALKLETKTDFEKGLSLYYDWQFAEAQVYFEQVLQRYPQDKAAQFYLQQMAELMEARPARTLEFSP